MDLGNTVDYLETIISWLIRLLCSLMWGRLFNRRSDYREVLVSFDWMCHIVRRDIWCRPWEQHRFFIRSGSISSKENIAACRIVNFVLIQLNGSELWTVEHRMKNQPEWKQLPTSDVNGVFRAVASDCFHKCVQLRWIDFFYSLAKVPLCTMSTNSG